MHSTDFDFGGLIQNEEKKIHKNIHKYALAISLYKERDKRTFRQPKVGA